MDSDLHGQQDPQEPIRRMLLASCTGHIAKEACIRMVLSTEEMLVPTARRRAICDISRIQVRIAHSHAIVLWHWTE